jgi:mono/diheme cytochrome c family protein
MMLAISTGQALLIGFGIGIGAVILVVGAVVGRRRAREPGPDIPAAMRPGPSDPDLEDPLRIKLFAWGTVLVLFMAVWLSAVWLLEPKQNQKDTNAMLAESLARGQATVNLNSEENPLGFGCVRCHGQNLHGGWNVFNNKLIKVPNLQTVCGGQKYGHPLIKGLQDVVNTISQGRPGTDMVSWSVRFSGAMDDQQINDIVNYILSIQKEPPADNICLAASTGTTTTSSASPSPGASASPSTSASPTG